MKLLMEEYGDVLLGAAAALAVIGLLAKLFIAEDAPFGLLLQYWIEGGC